MSAAAAPRLYFKIAPETVAPVVCPSCGEHYRATYSKPADAEGEPWYEPHTLSCAHTLCGVCWQGVEVSETPTCPVCRKAYTGSSVNTTLGDYSEQVYQIQVAQADGTIVELLGESEAKAKAASTGPSTPEEAAQLAALKAELLQLMEVCRNGAKRFSQAADRAALEKERLLRLKDESVAKVTADTDAYIKGMEEHRDKYIAMARAEFARKKALLEPQMEALKKQAAERAALVAAHNAAAAAAGGAGGEEGKAAEPFKLPPPEIVPCVPPVVVIVNKLKTLIDRIPSMIRVKEISVDASKSVVEGPGLTRFVAGESPAAAAQNVFTVTCNDQDGKLIEWIAPFDPLVKLGGEIIDPTVVVTSPGVLQITYTVPEGIATTQLAVTVCGVPLTGSPFTINA